MLSYRLLRLQYKNSLDNSTLDCAGISPDDGVAVRKRRWYNLAILALSVLENFRRLMIARNNVAGGRTARAGETRKTVSIVKVSNGARRHESDGIANRIKTSAEHQRTANVARGMLLARRISISNSFQNRARISITLAASSGNYWRFSRRAKKARRVETGRWRDVAAQTRSAARWLPRRISPAHRALRASGPSIHSWRGGRTGAVSPSRP